MELVGVPERNQYAIDVDGNVSDLLTALGLNSQEYIVMKNEKILPADGELYDGDELIILRIVSGG